MKHKLILWIGLFISGYLTANKGLPKGEEFLMFESIAWIEGMYAGALVTKFYYKMKLRPKENKVFRVLGFEIKLNKSGANQSVPVIRLVQPEPIQVAAKNLETILETAPPKAN
jgi:hypothetical protein